MPSLLNLAGYPLDNIQVLLLASLAEILDPVFTPR